MGYKKNRQEPTVNENHTMPAYQEEKVEYSRLLGLRWILLDAWNRSPDLLERISFVLVSLSMRFQQHGVGALLEELGVGTRKGSIVVIPGERFIEEKRIDIEAFTG